MNNHYRTAQEIYADWGVDTEEALRRMDEIPISINCWQLDDLTGFEDFGAALTGGIAATGNALGKPRSIKEYFANLDKMLSLVPGAKNLALHSVYAITGGRKVSRNELKPEDFAPWVEYARKKGIGLDFNPTYFSHPMLKDGWTLSSPDRDVRNFWVEHGIACRKIGEYFGRELGTTCITNHWIPDGSKDTRIDTLGPRQRLIDSLNRIFAEPVDKKYNIDSVEGKVFGLGVESYTVGSYDFYLGYGAKNNQMVTLDTGHFHLTESIADKVSCLLLFTPEIMLHVSRPIRWDSDHVVILNDDLTDLARELVRCKALDRVHIGLDYFDATINRIGAYVIGTRATQKALLMALLEPSETLQKYEAENKLFQRLALQEELKSMPWNAVWDMFCLKNDVPVGENYIKEIEKYEADVTSKR